MEKLELKHYLDGESTYYNLMKLEMKINEIIDWINKVKHFKGTPTGHELWLYKKNNK